MTVFVCLVQSGVGGGVLLATAYARVCTGVHVCDSAYVHMSLSAHYTWLFFPERVLCSTLHDLQSHEPSSRSFL